MKFLKPSEIDECEYYDFISEFITTGESFTPYSLDQRGLEFKDYIEP